MGKRTKKRKTKLSFFAVAVIAVVFIALLPGYLKFVSGYDLKQEYPENLCLPADSEECIYHPHYWLKYSEEHEQAQWVATVLEGTDMLSKTVQRSDSFIQDPLVKTGSSVPQDYSRSGFDRGHILSFASNGWSEETGNASFYMSNMSPQYPNTNRYTYERIEEAERSCAVQNGKLAVVHGPVLSDGPFEKIGKENSISIPNSYFVCFLDYTGNTQKAIGFIVPNDNKIYKDIAALAVPVNEIENLTGLDFWPLLPDSLEEKLESMCSPADWELSRFSRESLASKYGYDLDNLKKSGSDSVRPTLKTYLIYLINRILNQ